MHRSAWTSRGTKLLVASVVLLIGSGSVGWADGGDPDMIHACLGPTGGVGSSVVIVAPNETCPMDYPNPVHWPGNAQGVFEDLPEPEQPLANGTMAGPVFKMLQPNKKTIKLVYSKLKVQPKLTIQVENSGQPGNWIYGYLGVECPGSHPFLMSGGYALFPQVAHTVLANGPVGLHAWHTSVYTGWGGFLKTKTLTVSAVCAKVAKA